MKHFKCPHNKFQSISDEAYCRECKSFIFSIEETTRREMKLNRLITNNPKFFVTIEFMETFK